jgi:hypothetical protein
VVPEERDDLAGTVARSLAERTAPEAERLDPFLLMLRSATDPVAAPIVRQGIEAHVGARFARLIGGEEADVRAQLGLALVSGVWLLRTVIGTGALTSVDDDRLAALLTRMLDPITSGSDNPEPGRAS